MRQLSASDQRVMRYLHLENIGRVILTETKRDRLLRTRYEADGFINSHAVSVVLLTKFKHITLITAGRLMFGGGVFVVTERKNTDNT